VVTREQALAIVEAHLRGNSAEMEPRNGNAEPLRAVDGDAWPPEIKIPTPYSAASSIGGFPRGFWVIYLPGPAGWIASSTIVVVRKTTGEIEYEGSAHDEG
jgi:hypothetical protein